MREIRFRAYLKDSAIKGLNKEHFKTHGRIFDVSVIDFESQTIKIRTPSELEFDFKDVVLMQFTGLKDKHGKDVYEGDIIKHYQADVNVVEFDYFCWGISNHHASHLPFYTQNMDNCEVIGNIWEHPHLLETK